MSMTGMVVETVVTGVPHSFPGDANGWPPMVIEGLAAAAVELSGAAPLERRGGGKRHQSVLLIGRVQGVTGAPVCLVHDISKAGMMARFDRPPVVGDVLTVEVRGLPPATGTVRWVRGHKAGLQFSEPQELERIFALRRADGTTARAPRFPLSAPAQLRLDGRRLVAELLDLSAGGAKLALAAAGPQPGQTGALHLVAVDEPLFGTVCWARDDRAGFRFAKPLPLAQLTRILAG